jgi:hypothetical protein
MKVKIYGCAQFKKMLGCGIETEPLKYVSSWQWLNFTQITCRNLFKKELYILPVRCQYTFSLKNFFVNNQENCQINPSVHSINKRNKHHLHRTVANLSRVQKSAFYSSIRIFDSLIYSVINLKNEKAQFKVALRRHLNAHSFYYADEFLMYTDKL